jgi:hypothetical protein
MLEKTYLVSFRNDNHIVIIDVLEFKGYNRNKILIHTCVLLESVIVTYKKLEVHGFFEFAIIYVKHIQTCASQFSKYYIIFYLKGHSCNFTYLNISMYIYELCIL